MIKTRKVTKKGIECFTECKYCGKEIKGSTQGMVRFNLQTHIRSKHKNEKI